MPDHAAFRERRRAMLLAGVVGALVLAIGLPQTAAAVETVPVNKVAPYITIAKPNTHAVPGAKLTCAKGTWSGGGKIKLTYQWLRDGAPISGQTLVGYKVLASDVTHLLSCQVTATNLKGSTTATSPSLEAAIPPKYTGSGPEVEGLPHVGETLTCVNQGNWTGEPAPTFTYRWVREGVPITSFSTGNTYELQLADAGHLVSCRVNGENPGGVSEIASAAVAVFQGPHDTAPPTVSIVGGGAQDEVGGQLECSQGTWEGTGLKYEYEWLRSGTVAAAYSSAAGANVYTTVAADLGHTLTCVVKATNYTSVEAPSANGVEAVAAPQSTAAPEASVVGGAVAEPGSTLACSTGGWSASPSPTFEYEWLREGGTVVAAFSGGEHASEYTAVSGDVGQRLYCVVRATNVAGQAQAESATVAVLAKPVSTVPPAVGVVGGGYAVEGSTLNCSTGEWSGTPARYEFAYEWLRDGSEVLLPTGSTYPVGAADIGHRISCRVSATNRAGFGQATSANSVEGVAAPSSSAPPQVTVKGGGSAEAASTLVCSSGGWSGTPAPTFEYEWLRDGTTVLAGFSGGEGASEYTVLAADVGHEVSCVVRAVNKVGEAREASAGTPVLAKPAPTTAPEVTGTPEVGQALTCEPGAWTGDPAPTFAFAWLRDGSAIEGAESSTYTIQEADAGHQLSCVVTASNSAGSAEAPSSNEVSVPL